MPVRVKNISLWRKEVENQVGSLAHTLEPFTRAGANLHVLMEYRYRGEGAKAAIELYPIAGNTASDTVRVRGLRQHSLTSIAKVRL